VTTLHTQTWEGPFLVHVIRSILQRCRASTLRFTFLVPRLELSCNSKVQNEMTGHLPYQSSDSSTEFVCECRWRWLGAWKPGSWIVELHRDAPDRGVNPRMEFLSG
jgi:hypothetical protein